jgi:hypothetical protein
MLLAVQQMVDALSALKITHKLLATMEQPAPQPQQPLTAFSTSSAGGISTSTAGQAGDAAVSNKNSRYGGSQGASAEQCVQWQQQLLLHELVMPIDSSFRQLLGELAVLVGLVGAHVRVPTDASRVALLNKVRPAPKQARETGMIAWRTDCLGKSQDNSAALRRFSSG